ncbi:MAG: CpsD/CapB family tyrosine-protein kinase [Clostridia bacterium]|nr:CpsD/CapB family tyrosine-protein kinase [Clostridia bacterium]
MKKELLTYQDPKSPVSEVFRTLRTNIQFMNTNRKLKTLLVTSTFPEEGKSWIAANLAVTFAQAGKKVILLDADMRKGRQYKIFDVLPKPGLSNYLSNMDADNLEVSDVNIVNYIQATGIDNLHVLVAGNVPPNPSELLVSTKMRELLKDLKEMCDLIIIDGTPCDLVTDSIILSRFVDSTIIVTAQKETKKDALQRITKNIQNVGGRIAGVIVNKVDTSSKKYKQSYYYGSMGTGLIKVEDSGRRHKRNKIDYNMSSLFSDSDNKTDEIEDFNNTSASVNESINNEAKDIINDLVNKMEQEDVEKTIEQPIKEQEIDEPKKEIFEQEPEVQEPEKVEVQEPEKTQEQIIEEKTQDIINQVNNYIQNELNKHN